MMSDATKRSILRWIHIIFGIPILGYGKFEPQHCVLNAHRPAVAELERYNNHSKGG
jgi:hypothetical protein